MKLSRQLGGLLAAGALIAVPATQAIPASARAPIAVAARTCKRGTPAKISGVTRCLQRGEYCATRNQRIYRAHGFVCRGGRLH